MSHPDLTPDQIDILAREWFATALEADEEYRTQVPTGRAAYTTTDEYDDPVAADLEVLSWLEGEYREAFAHNDFQRVHLDVERMLEEAGVPADRKSEAYRRLARALLRANAEVLRLAQARRVGKYALEPEDPLFRSKPMPTPVVAQPDPALSSMPLRDLVTVYAEAQEKDGKWTADTKRNTIPVLIRFAGMLDSKPVDMVSRDDIRAWRQGFGRYGVPPCGRMSARTGSALVCPNAAPRSMEPCAASDTRPLSS